MNRIFKKSELREDRFYLIYKNFGRGQKELFIGQANNLTRYSWDLSIRNAYGTYWYYMSNVTNKNWGIKDDSLLNYIDFEYELYIHKVYELTESEIMNQIILEQI